MLLRRIKTKNFFHKILQNLKSCFFGGYQKLQAPPFNPCPCGTNNQKNHQTDQFCIDFPDQWVSDIDKTKSRKKNMLSLKETMKDEDACSGSFMKFVKQSPLKSKQDEGGKQVENRGHSHLGKEELCSQNMDGGCYALAQKLKELEMMDVGDVEQVLDIEEALHYYSRLKSPVYLDIVNKFSMDMYSEFSTRQATVSNNNLKGRLSSMRW